MVLDQRDLECVECKRLEDLLIAARNTITRKLKFSGQRAPVPARIAEELKEAELSALSAYKNHRAGHQE